MKGLSWQLAALSVAVAVVHGCVADGIATLMLDNATSFAGRGGDTMPHRVSVAYVKDMDLAAPPAEPPPRVNG